MQGPPLQLRVYAVVDRMQPQYASMMATLMTGNVPSQGNSSLFVEVAPGNLVYKAVDIALKSADVELGLQLVERVFGVFEIHGTQGAVRAAGSAMLEAFNLNEGDRLKPTIVSSQIITNVDPQQSAAINQQRRGSMLVAGQSLLVIETSPAGYATYAANEIEKSADINIVMIQSIGAAGRVLAAGTQSQVAGALEAVETAFAGLSGREAPAGPGGPG
jgi:ethanolamine utilization microcompartment shell protein EutS